jgi:2-oxo-4-hydroxy-4-carboxy--5-ureidoimidazoline (OHCU) decarboxylase
MFKEFLMKKMLQKQMAGMPEAEQEKMLGLLEKNPDLFAKINASVQEKIKIGKDQMTAALEVANEFKDELSKAING